MKLSDQDQTSSVLTLENLRMHYFTLEGVVKAVDGIDMEIKRGNLIGLIGESGCGKSSIALSILRLLPPYARIVEGRILSHRVDIARLSERELTRMRGKEISMIFQDPTNCLNPIMKIKDQITEAICLHQNLSRSEAQQRTIEILEDLELPSAREVAESYPHQLSGGMKQRIMIGMALSLDPYLLIADEPTSSLDVSTQLKILHLLRTKCKKFNTSLLMITHDLGIVVEVCERVYVMYAGKIMESATVQDLCKTPAHPYTIALLRSIIRIDQPTKVFSSISGRVATISDAPSGCVFHPRCPKATEKCREKPPSVTRLKDDHIAYCWHIEG
jgi:oligopeptide/dipeptide ABC transporter ATP-binding protein